MGSHQFCLKWNNYHSNLLDVFEQLLLSQALVDVTLACEGFTLKAHKMVLSACSPFFHDLFMENPCKHPIVILKDMNYVDLKAIINFMYRGEVNVAEGQLAALLKAAETLKVKGLAESTNDGKPSDPETFGASRSGFGMSQSPQQQSGSPNARRRKKLRVRRRPRSPNVSGSEDQISSKGQEETSEEMDESDSGEVKRKLKDTLLRRLSTTHTGSEALETARGECDQLESLHFDGSPKDCLQEDNNSSRDVDNLPKEEDAESMEKSTTTLLPERHTENHTSILARQLSLPPGIMTARPMSDLHLPASSQIQGPTNSYPLETTHDSDADVKPAITFEESSPSQLSLKFQPESARSNDSMLSLFLDAPQINLLPCIAGDFQMDVQQSQNQVLRGLLDVSNQGESSVYSKVVCSVCDKIFNSSSSMRRHMREQHCPDASLNFVCDRCDKVFRRKEHLLLHMKRHH